MLDHQGRRRQQRRADRLGRRRPGRRLHRARARHGLGVTLFDTADVHGLGRSERLLGRPLADVRRDESVVSSKVGYFSGTGPHSYHPDQMRHQLATTLANLGTDHLDVYLFHSTDFGPGDQYLADAVQLMHDWHAQGVIRAIGMRAPHTFAEQRADGDDPRTAEAARFLRPVPRDRTRRGHRPLQPALRRRARPTTSPSPVATTSA